jgi:hypothetical protein
VSSQKEDDRIEARSAHSVIPEFNPEYENAVVKADPSTAPRIKEASFTGVLTQAIPVLILLAPRCSLQFIL